MKIRKSLLSTLLLLAACAALTAVLWALLNKPETAVGASSSEAASADDTIAWGMRYLAPNTLPEVSSRGAELLRKYNGMYTGDTTQKKIYFTFDLGYEAGFTGEVLDILKKHGAKGIFFLCGHYLTEEALVGRMLAEGHAIGNHTKRHTDLSAAPEDKARGDIDALQTEYREKYGGELAFFRPPSGRFNERALRLINNAGLKTVMWSVAYADWGAKAGDVEQIMALLSKRVHPGAIVLLHITNASTPKVLDRLFEWMHENGYSAGTPDELLHLQA